MVASSTPCSASLASSEAMASLARWRSWVWGWTHIMADECWKMGVVVAMVASCTPSFASQASLGAVASTAWWRSWAWGWTLRMIDTCWQGGEVAGKSALWMIFGTIILWSTSVGNPTWETQRSFGGYPDIGRVYNLQPPTHNHEHRWYLLKGTFLWHELRDDLAWLDAEYEEGLEAAECSGGYTDEVP